MRKIPNISGLNRINSARNWLPGSRIYQRGYPLIPRISKFKFNRRIFWLLELGKGDYTERYKVIMSRKRLPHPYERRRILKKLDGLGFVHWREFNEDALNFYDRVRRKSYKPGHEKLVGCYDLIESGMNLYVSEMLVDELVVSTVVYGTYRDCLYYIVPASLSSKFSYGILHLMELIDMANKENFKFVSALVSKGISGYKKNIFLDSYEVV